MFSKEFIHSILLCAISLCVVLDGNSQSTSFTSTLKEYRSTGWIFSIGGAGFQGSNTPWGDQRIQIDLFTGESDTLYYGTWTPNSKLHKTLGIGRVWLINEPILIDRINLNFIVSERNVTESFNGALAGEDTVIVGEYTSINLGLHATFFHSFTLSPDLFIEAGLGGGIRYDFFTNGVEVINLDEGFSEGLVPKPLSASLEAIVGVGAMRFRGRFVRVHLAVDLLQLNPINGTSKTPWMLGEYRPYRVILNFDVFRRKPADGCAKPNFSEKSRELFGEEMRGWRKVKNNWKKRRMSRRKRIL